jgi:hypothetical protein
MSDTEESLVEWMRLAYNYFSFKSLAFIATITVLKLISTAPIAGLSMNAGYRIPATNGIAITL